MVYMVYIWYIYEPKTKKNMKSEITLFENVSEEYVSERGRSLRLPDTVYRHAGLSEFHENPEKPRKLLFCIHI